MQPLSRWSGNPSWSHHVTVQNLHMQPIWTCVEFRDAFLLAHRPSPVSTTAVAMFFEAKAGFLTWSLMCCPSTSPPGCGPFSSSRSSAIQDWTHRVVWIALPKRMVCRYACFFPLGCNSRVSKKVLVDPLAPRCFHPTWPLSTPDHLSHLSFSDSCGTRIGSTGVLTLGHFFVCTLLVNSKPRRKSSEGFRILGWSFQPLPDFLTSSPSGLPWATIVAPSRFWTKSSRSTPGEHGGDHVSGSCKHGSSM